MLFCAFVCTAWAGPTDLPEITTDLENPVYYTITNTRSSQPGGFMYYAGDEVGLKDGWTFSSELDDKYKFFFTGSHDALYVHNAATGKKLASMSAWSEEGTVWAVGVSPKGGGLAFGPQGGLNGNACWNEKNYATDANTSDFTTWSANDDGSIFLCDKVAELCLPETGKFYVIEAPLFNSVQGVQKGLYADGSYYPAWGTIDLTDKAFYWIPTVNPENGQVALKNAKTETYLFGGGEMVAKAAYGSLKYLGQNQWNIVSNNVTVHANGHGNGYSNGGNIVNWGGAANTASAWTFIEKADPDAAVEVEVIYNFTYNGVERPEVKQTVTTLVGEEYPNITTLPYGVAASKPEGVIANADVVDGKVTKTIEVANNLPFVPAADYASITQWYYIEMHSSAGLGKYLQDITTGIEWADTEVDVNNVGTYAWSFVGNPFEGFKLVNYAAGNSKGVNADPTANPVVEPVVGDIATATQWVIKPSATNKESQYFCFQYPNSNQYMNAQSGAVKYWTSADQGSTMWLTECDPTSQLVTVNYSYKYNDVEYYTQATDVLVGEEYPNLNVTLPWGVTATKPEGTVTAGATNVDVELVVNYPFEFADTYANLEANGAWYYLIIKGANYLSHVDEQGYIDLTKTSVDSNSKDAYTWGFVGTPFTGFKIVNRAAGEGMVLSSTTTITDDANTFPVLTELPVAEGNNELWVLTGSTYQENGFYLAQKDFASNRMNNRDGKLAYWTGGADNGSTFTVTWRDVTGVAELQALVDACLANDVPAGVVGGYTQESYDAVVAAIATAQAELAKDVKDVAAIAAATATLQNAVAALTVQLPNPGSFYKIKNAYTGAYMGAANGSGIVGVATDFSGLGQIFQFEAADGGNFYLKNVERGAYLNSAKAHTHGQNTLGAKEAAVAVSINSFGMEARVAIRPEGGAELHHDTNTNGVVGWNTGSADSKSAWVIIEVADLEGYTHTVSVTDAGWATLYLGYNAEIPEGVTAYAVSSVDAESATLEEVKNVLPANTAVLLNATAGDYNFDFTAATAEVANNVLRGTVFNTAIPEDIYVLGNGTAGVGFYKAIKNMNVDTSDDIVEGEGEEAVTTPVNDAVLNNAFKAYLPANGVAAQALRFNFGGTTAIESVVNGINANAAIYDLSGRRVEKATKGIYIVNGKKMIVK